MPVSRQRFRLSAPFFAALCAALATSLAAGQDDGKLKFEVYKDKAGEFRWSLKAANGATLATAGQGYKDRAAATHGVELVKKAGTDDKLKFETYEDAKGEYRWRLKAGNGQVVAASSEGYKAKAAAEKAIDLIKAGASKADVVDLKG